jgi:Domain of unknown function (DUF1844)
VAESHQADNPGFTFVDKRRRGEPADATPEPPHREAPVRETPRRETPPPRDPREPPRGGGAPASLLEGGGPMQANLTSLCAMFYSEALVHLGQVADPATGQPHLDLEQARFTIDMLAMLKEKTEGNRTAEESAVLDEVLTALRMGFVQLSRRR